MRGSGRPHAPCCGARSGSGPSASAVSTGRLVLVLLLLAALLGCARATERVSSGAPQFHLDWQATSEPRGSVVRGQLVNGHALPARDIHLLVEALDASGDVVSRTTSVLRRIVLSGERAPFDVLVPGHAERYRVTVASFDLVLPRGRR